MFRQFFSCCIYEKLPLGSGLCCCFEPAIVLGPCPTGCVMQWERSMLGDTVCTGSIAALVNRTSTLCFQVSSLALFLELS